MTIRASDGLYKTNWERINFYTYRRTKETSDKITSVTYQIQLYIGQGATGTLYELCPLDPAKKSKAIKLCTYPQQDHTQCPIGREHKILSHLPQIPGLSSSPKAFIPYDDERGFPDALILPLYGGNFYTGVRSLSDQELLTQAKTLCETLVHMHDHLQLAHGDIKGDNLLYDPKTQTIRLIDFDKSVHHPQLTLPTSAYDAQRFACVKKKDVMNLKNLLSEVLMIRSYTSTHPTLRQAARALREEIEEAHALLTSLTQLIDQ